MNFITYLPVIIFPLARATLGWLENALEDGKITKIELMQLLCTTVRVGAPAVALTLGFNISPTAAASIASVVDIFLHKFKS